MGTGIGAALALAAPEFRLRRNRQAETEAALPG